MCKPKHGGGSWQPRTPGGRQPGWGSPGWPPSRRFNDLEGQEVGDVCLPMNEGGPMSKRSTRRWYDAQNREGGWWFGFTRTAAGDAWRTGGLRAWFQWVFLRLDEHEEACKWRRCAQVLRARG